ncbi:hypothetical protein KDW_63980 [Dictyobacter vulcani]|uniref:Uncharacterized protein n=1 Tax=Dictyobacter vulcani TaxID=2607529 RepID=A0A5J4L446_9CHLR|nr:hypothetical protein [Dictyobacter vulcani]GER92236.1 hypothetical protein KDW_63980 [Dictyobacter vulcani]
MQGDPPYYDPSRPGGPGLEPKVKSSVKSFTEEEAKTFAENHRFIHADPNSKRKLSVLRL